MFKLLFVVLILLVILAYVYPADSIYSGGDDVIGSGKKDIDTVVILILKAPIGVQEMRKKYIKTDTQPPHITLGYLEPHFDEKEVLKHLRSIKPNPIEFTEWVHSESFIGLIPKNIKEINRIIGPMHKYMENYARGGFHMSLAYKSQSAPLDMYTFKKAHELVQTPLTCPVKEIRISRRRGGGDWVKYKSVIF